MSLREYRRKRDFKRTSEPKGASAKDSDEGMRFVVHKHAARRLHYDLRLELDGVLKSWAVTRGPSLVPGDKRLAVQTEDHPIEYLDFEGPIPQGEYGAGRMIVWDQGTWRSDTDPHRQLAKGHLSFELKGEKLGGAWHLVRLKTDREKKRTRSAKENWLLIKSDDAAAEPPGADVLAEQPRSTKTGRTIEEVEPPPPPREKLATSVPGEEVSANRRRTKRKALELPAGAKPAPLPEFVPPALATLSEKPPAGARWAHEVKFDGYRLIARIERGHVKLRTRSGLDWTERFQGLVGPLAALEAKSAMLDGEVVVEGKDGASSFPELQADLSAGRSDRFVYYVFDLLYLDGNDLREVPARERRRLLEDFVGNDGQHVRVSTQFAEDGAVVLKHSCRLGLEGIVSKRLDAPYRSGRTPVWMKSKCVTGDEFVIVGYTPSTVQRRAIGALVLARRGAEGLVYAGRVGTGFSVATSEELWQRLQPMHASTPAVPSLSAEARRGVRWVVPDLVASVDYRALTGDGLLRHAAFKGLRDDKSVADLAAAPDPAKTRSKSVKGRTIPGLHLGHLSHADRPLWPEDGVTKEGLAGYLTEVWDWIAPYVVERPLALVRCPDGVAGGCFFQKHRFAGISLAIGIAADPDDGKDILFIRDLEGLVGLAQASVCEIHTWGARLADPEHPDMVTFDLDPAEDTGWDAVVAAAFDVRDRLAALRLPSFVKTSGGKGLHVVAPLKPRAGWDEVKNFAGGLAAQMAKDSPERYTDVMSKRVRQGRIFIDYLRNGRGATTVAAYSPRARAGAAVSIPIAWTELNAGMKPDRFDIANVLNRLTHSQDPWADFFKSARPLPSLAKAR